MDKNRIAAKFIVGAIATGVGFGIMKAGVMRILDGTEMLVGGLAKRASEY